MSAESWFKALFYEAGLWAVSRFPWLVIISSFKEAMKECLPAWSEWKTKVVMEEINGEAKQLLEQWKNDEGKLLSDKLSKQARERFPDAKITPLPDEAVPSVLIEMAPPANASEAVKSLGGELQITYKFDNF
jgi:hypothetical protein